MKLNRAQFYIAVILITVSCGLFSDDPNLPNNHKGKTETIYFSGILSTSSNEWYLSPTLQRNSFDKSKYASIDSIIFLIGLRTPTADVSSNAQLYNISSNAPVSDSYVSTMVNYQLNQVRSSDLQYSLPNEPVMLGVRIQSSKEGVTVYSGDGSSLVVYYK